MTIADAISQVDKLVPNRFTDEEKIKWLTNLDMRVKTKIIDAHECVDPISFYGYDSTDIASDLLIPPPFDEIYPRWLEAMIHYHNSEDDRYNNAMVLVNSTYKQYGDYYARNHMPISRGGRFVF